LIKSRSLIFAAVAEIDVKSLLSSISSVFTLIPSITKVSTPVPVISRSSIEPATVKVVRSF